MNSYNVFDILVTFVSATIPQLGGIGTKAQDLVTPFKMIKDE